MKYDYLEQKKAEVIIDLLTNEIIQKEGEIIIAKDKIKKLEELLAKYESEPVSAKGAASKPKIETR